MVNNKFSLLVQERQPGMLVIILSIHSPFCTWDKEYIW